MFRPYSVSHSLILVAHLSPSLTHSITYSLTPTLTHLLAYSMDFTLSRPTSLNWCLSLTDASLVVLSLDHRGQLHGCIVSVQFSIKHCSCLIRCCKPASQCAAHNAQSAPRNVKMSSFGFPCCPSTIFRHDLSSNKSCVFCV